MSKALHSLVGFSLIVGLMLSVTTAEAQAVSLTRYPYIQSLTTTSVVIAWRTDIPANSLIYYDFSPWADPSQYRFSVSDDVQTTEHALTLTGLFSNTTYYYCVESDGVILASGESFHTARTTSNQRFRFAVISDNHSGRESTAELAERLQEAELALLIVAGDLVFAHGGPGELDKFFNYFEEIIKNIPVFPCLGNHDWYEDNAEWYLKEFYLPHNNPEDSELYYSFDYGNAHFVSLCVVEPEMLDWKEGSAQYNWLVDDLASTNQFWKFVFFHFPPYDSGGRYADDKFLEVRQNLSPLLERYGVDIVFTGHEHLYERTFPMKDYYPDSKGVTYIVCGSFIGVLRESGPGPWTTFVGEDDQVTGTIVDIDGPVLNLRTINIEGELIDSMTIDRSHDLQVSMEVSPTIFTEETEFEWFSVYLELSGGYDPSDIDINFVALNNELKPVSTFQDLVDRDGDGLKEREFKFDYKQVFKMLVIDEGNAHLQLTGSIDGDEFQATTTVCLVPRGATYKTMVADVGAGGGLVETSDGQITVSLPGGTVTEQTKVIIRQEPSAVVPPVPPSLKESKIHFDIITGNGLSTGNMASIKVKYTEADIAPGVQPELLTLLRYDAGTGDWVVIPTTVNVPERTVMVTTDHIQGVWLLAGATGKILGLPLWGWVAIGVVIILLTIFLVWRYT